MARGKRVEVSINTRRFAVYSVGQRGPGKLHVAVHLDEVGHDDPSTEQVETRLATIPKTAPLFVVCCSSAASGVEVVTAAIRDEESMIEDGKISAHSMKPGSITRIRC